MQDQNQEHDISDLLDRIEQLEDEVQRIDDLKTEVKELETEVDRLEQLVDDDGTAAAVMDDDSDEIYEDYLDALADHQLPEKWNPSDELVEAVVDRDWAVIKPPHAAMACEQMKRHPGSKEIKIELTTAAVRWVGLHTDERDKNKTTREKIDDCIEHVAGMTSRQSSYRTAIQDRMHAGPDQRMTSVIWETMPSAVAYWHLVRIDTKPADVIRSLIEIHRGGELDDAADLLYTDEDEHAISEAAADVLDESHFIGAISSDWDDFELFQPAVVGLCNACNKGVPAGLVVEWTVENYSFDDEMSNLDDFVEVAEEGLERARAWDTTPVSDPDI